MGRSGAGTGFSGAGGGRWRQIKRKLKRNAEKGGSGAKKRAKVGFPRARAVSVTRGPCWDSMGEGRGGEQKKNRRGRGSPPKKGKGESNDARSYAASPAPLLSRGVREGGGPPWRVSTKGEAAAGRAGGDEVATAKEAD